MKAVQSNLKDKMGTPTMFNQLSDNHNILDWQSENKPEEEVVHDDHPEPDVEGHEEDHFFNAAEHHENRPSAPASPTQPVAAKPKVQCPTPQRNLHPHINGIFLIHSFFFYIIIQNYRSTL